MSKSSRSEAPKPAEWLGRTLDGRYRIEAPLGAGGLGLVLRATHLGLDRPVAVKVLHQELLSNTSFRERFQREVQTLSRFAHPHVVMLLDGGVLSSGEGYLVMELLEGESLEQRLGRGPMAPDEALAVGRQLLLGLAEAHAKGILHRDIKPGNVFLQPLADRGAHVKLLDFGLAKVRGDMASDPSAYATLTADGTIVGTPTYMAPEQAAGARVDASSDVYAAGVVLFEMLTGRPPFQGDSALETIRAHLRDPIPELDAVRPRLQPTDELRALIRSALAKERPARFASAKEMLGALDALPNPAATLSDDPDAPAEASIRGTEDTLAIGSSQLEAVSGTELATSRSSQVKTVAATTGGRAAVGGGKTRRDRYRGAFFAVGMVALATAGAAAWWLAPGAEVSVGGADPEVNAASAEDEGDWVAAVEENGDADPTQEVVAEEQDGRGNPFRDSPLPEELRAPRRQILRGRWLSESQTREVTRYQRAHPQDPRPSLLLARHYRLQGQYRPMVRQYRNAYRIDPNVTGFSPMLPDLVRAVRDGPAGRDALRAVRVIYGRRALPEVEAALRGRLTEPERRRLTRLQRRLHVTPE